MGALKEALKHIPPENQNFDYLQIRQSDHEIHVQRKIILDPGIRGNSLFQVDLDAHTGEVIRKSFPRNSLYEVIVDSVTP